MKLSVRQSCKAFTLAEVLAALAFMAIVIPVAVEGLRLASTAGQLGQRRTVAGQVAERVLDEMILSQQSQGVSQGMTQSGRTYEGAHEYRWSARWQPWPEDSMNQLSIQVLFEVQGREYDLWLTTLIDSSS